jgi:hypothetical protein
MSIFNLINDFFFQIYDFLSVGLYDFFAKVFAEFIIYSTIVFIKSKIFMLEFSYSVAQEIISSLNISSFLKNSFSSLNSKLLSFLNFFKIIESINIVISAYVTKFVLKFIGL